MGIPLVGTMDEESKWTTALVGDLPTGRGAANGP